MYDASLLHYKYLQASRINFLHYPAYKYFIIFYTLVLAESLYLFQRALLYYQLEIFAFSYFSPTSTEFSSPGVYPITLKPSWQYFSRHHVERFNPKATMKNDACTTNLNAALHECSLKREIIHNCNEF